MTASNLYTRRISGMDYRVWTAMLITCLLCLAFYGYRQIEISSASHQPCGSGSILINGEEGKSTAFCELKRNYMFKILTEKNAKVEWNFDDGTHDEQGHIVNHSFTQQGIYNVVARVNGYCKYQLEVTVKEPFLLPLEKPVLEIHTDSNSLKAGNSANFFCVTNQQVNNYEWTLQGTNEVRQSEDAVFTFAKAGTYIVALVINNDPSKKIFKTITVAETPMVVQDFDNSELGKFDGKLEKLIEEDDASKKTKEQHKNADTVKAIQDNLQEGPPKPIQVDNERFKGLLQEVLNEEKDIEVLDKYLAYPESTIVDIKGERMSLKKFCREKKKRKIKTLELIKEKENQQNIQTIKLELRKKIGPITL